MINNFYCSKILSTECPVRNVFGEGGGQITECQSRFITFLDILIFTQTHYVFVRLPNGFLMFYGTFGFKNPPPG